MRETLAEYEARGGQITRCPAISDDPEAAIERARRAARRERKAAASPGKGEKKGEGA